MFIKTPTSCCGNCEQRGVKLIRLPGCRVESSVLRDKFQVVDLVKDPEVRKQFRDL